MTTSRTSIFSEDFGEMRNLGLLSLAALIPIAAKPSFIDGPKAKKVASTLQRKPGDHPAMPEGGWPETRQQRRARERRNA